MSKLATRMSRYVPVKTSDYSFMEEREGASAKEAWELFQLNDEGQWIQEWMPPLIHDKPDSEEQVYGNGFDKDQHKELTAIKGFQGDDGEKLLRFLNEQTKKQQLENGANESDVFQGTVILNSLGNIIPVCYSYSHPHTY